MIKIIAKYSTQEWNGDRYLYKELSRVLTFENLEQVTNENIKDLLGDTLIEVLDLTQIKDIK